MTAFIDLIKNRTISFIELESILNLLDDPVILVDQNDEIALVNSALVEATAFPSHEIIQTPFRSLLLEERADNGGIRHKLLRKNRRALDVQIHKSILDDKQRWKIYILIPSLQAHTHYDESIQELLSSYAKIITIQDESYTIFCEKGLEILADTFQFDLLGIYFDENGISQLSTLKKQKKLEMPLKIASVELENLSHFSIWHQGNRAINILQRTARGQGINSLLIQHLYDEEGKDGFIVAGWKDLIKDSAFLAIAEQFMGIFEYGTSLYHVQKTASRIKQEADGAQEIMHDLFENTHEGVIMVGEDKQILDINQNMESLLGYSKWETMGLHLDEYLVAEPSISDLFKNTFSSQEEQSEEKVTLHRRDGIEEPAIIRVVPIKNRVEKEQYLIFIRYTRVQDEMTRTIKDLEHQAALGKSVASFAHEVRNPVNNMTVNLQAIQATAELNEEQQQMVAGMLNDCERLTHLMDSILSYAKPLEKKLKPMNLDLLIRMVVEKWEAKFQRNNVELVYQCENNIPMVLGDMRSLEQVFTNLISNALEAMKSQNGGTLAIKIENWEDSSLRVNISDTGPGIPEEIMQRLFSPFVSFSLQGTGLGLAITQEIVNAHDGEISVESFPGGTVFHVIFPQIQGDSQ
ncbi:MAG TPA: hypothetical protein DCK95_07935 [Anaerolineaceae bacterium]|nr:hypothetical protein [Anaerolineaceae bacterium]